MRCSSLAYRALIALVLLCVVSNVVSSSTSEQPPRLLPSKRSYDTHHYYALEIWPSHTHISPAQAAALLGVEFIEQIGELAHHYLVRSEKPWEKETSGRLKRRHLPIHEDPILRRWFTLSQANRSPALAKRNGLETKELRVSFAIRSLERQELRIRHKRDKIISPWDTPHLFPQVRDPIAGPEPKPYPEPLPRPPILPAGKVAKMQDLHQINDPIFPEQWHLANDKRAGYDLNVSSVWAANITGKGVNVCLIDDGLDMKSPDLVSNFVSKEEKGDVSFLIRRLGQLADISTFFAFLTSLLVARTILMLTLRFLNLVFRTISMALDVLEKLLPSRMMYVE